MTVSNIDLNAIRDRIIAIIQSNSALWDGGKQGLKGPSSPTLINRIDKAIPRGNGVPKTFPWLGVVPGQPLKKKDIMGPATWYNYIRFKLFLMVSGDDPEAVSIKLLAIHKVVLDTLESNQKLTNPSDPNDTVGLVKHNREEITNMLPPGSLGNHTVVDGLEITLLVEMYNS